MCVLSGNKPVQCTCGHTVSSGFVCEETITVMYHGKPKTIIYTYCSEECAATTMREALDSYVDLEETQIKSEDDFLWEKADEERDSAV